MKQLLLLDIGDRRCPRCGGELIDVIELWGPGPGLECVNGHGFALPTGVPWEAPLFRPGGPFDPRPAKTVPRGMGEDWPGYEEAGP